MNTGKNQFDAIEIPLSLENTVRNSIRRGKRKKLSRRFGSCTAAAVLALFVAANIPPVYTQAAEMPLLGPLVRIMHVGSGGVSADHLTGHVECHTNRIQISFTDSYEKPAGVPEFSVAQKENPRRVTLRIHGLKQGGALDLVQKLKGQAALQDCYPLAVTDPTEQGVTFHLRPGWDCTAGQYAGSLELRFIQRESTPPRDCYVLCSAPLDIGPDLAALTEEFLWEGATQLRTGTNEYRVVIGEYHTADRAQNAREGIRDKTGANFQIAKITNGQLSICDQ